MKTLTKILVVDDDEDILRIIQFCFMATPNIQLKCVLSGEEAIQSAMESEPDLILLDVMMPKMDGLATLKAIRLIPKLSHIPVFFLTAKAQKKEIEDYLALGANEVIVKPFDPLTLPTMVFEKFEHCQKNPQS